MIITKSDVLITFYDLLSLLLSLSFGFRSSAAGLVLNPLLYVDIHCLLQFSPQSGYLRRI